MTRRKRTEPKITEGDVTKGVRDLLKALGIFHWKQFQTLGSPPGISDLIGIKVVRVQDLVDQGIDKVGVFWACELKKPKGGKRSTAQKRFIENVKDNHAIGFFAKSIEEFVEGLGLQDRVLF